MTHWMRLSLVAGVCLVACALAHLCVGSQWLSPSEVVAAMRGAPAEPWHDHIVMQLRVPRLLVAMLAGAALAMSGGLLQPTLANPLASPELTGATAGAACAAVCWGQFAPDAWTRDLSMSWNLVAGLGALVVGGVVVAVTYRRPPAVIAVVGVLVSAVIASVTSALILYRPVVQGSSIQWLFGSLNGRTWGHWHLLWPTALVCMVACVLVSPAANVLSLGDDAASSLGVRPSRSRVLAVGCAIVTAATATMAVGALGFVGLIGPHIARSMVGGDTRRLLPLAALLGAILVIVADVIAQSVGLIPGLFGGSARPALPVGAAVAVVGAPYFLRVASRLPT